MNSTTKRIDASDNKIIEEALQMVDEGWTVTFPVRGYSMLPFIIGDVDSVELKKPERIAVGHVVLAWVEGCRYVIHRIVDISGEKVTLMGDGNLGYTEHCLLTDVKALAASVVTPDGKVTPLYSPRMMRAARLWLRLLPVRRWILAVYRRTWLRLKTRKNKTKKNTNS